MANGNGTTKWLIALGVSVALAMGGWTYGASMAAHTRRIEDLKIDVRDTKELSVQADRRIYVLEEQYRAIAKSLEEIKTLIRQREENRQ